MTTTDTAPLGRRERKKLETRRSLQEAAFRLFREKGFDGTTVEDITEAADVAQRTFFRYFASKEQILIGSPDRLREELTATLNAQSDDTPVVEAVLAAVAALDADGGRTRGRTAVQRLRLRYQVAQECPAVRAAMLDSYRAQEACIAAYVARRTGLSATKDVYPQILAASISAAMRVGLATWVTQGCTGDVNDAFREAIDIQRSGLTPP